MVMMLPQYPVRQRAVPQEFDGAVEVAFEPLSGDARVGVVVQRLVDAGDGLHLLQHGADVVADEDDGAFLVDFRQQLVETGFETLVDVGAGLVEDDDFGVGDNGTSQQGTLQLPAAQGTDGARFQAFQPHAGDDLACLLPMRFREARGERLLAAEPRQDDLFDGDGELAVDAAVLRQIAHS